MKTFRNLHQLYVLVVLMKFIAFSYFFLSRSILFYFLFFILLSFVFDFEAVKSIQNAFFEKRRGRRRRREVEEKEERSSY